MPVEKKPKKKKTTRKTKAQKNLEQVMKKIPALIMNEAVSDKEKNTESVYIQKKYIEPAVKKKKKIAPIYEAPHKSKAWLWVGVFIFTIVIIVLWILNISTMFYESKQTYDPARTIIDSSKQELQNIIKTFSSKEELDESQDSEIETSEEQVDKTEDVQNLMKETLSNIFTTTNSPSSTVTSTE